MERMDPGRTFIPAVEAEFGPDRVLVVKDAAGGQPIRRWYYGWHPAGGPVPAGNGDLYERLLEKTRAAIVRRPLETVTLAWMQGEADALDSQAEVYDESLRGLRRQLEEDLDRPRINVVIGRLSDHDLENKRHPHWTRIRRIQMDYAGAEPHTTWIDTDDLNDGPDAEGKVLANDLHYSVAGYDALGRRFADAAIALIHAAD